MPNFVSRHNLGELVENIDLDKGLVPTDTVGVEPSVRQPCLRRPEKMAASMLCSEDCTLGAETVEDLCPLVDVKLGRSERRREPRLVPVCGVAPRISVLHKRGHVEVDQGVNFTALVPLLSRSGLWESLRSA